jgi:predicted transcriptional regulator
MPGGRKRIDPKQRLQHVGVMLPPDVHAKLIRMANQMNVPKSTMARKIIVHSFNENDKEVEQLMESNK